MPRSLVGVLRRNLRAALAENDLESAEALLTQLEEEDPVSVDSRGLRLEYLQQAGRLDEAGVLADQLRTLFPGSARIHFLAGRTAYRRRQYVDAVRSFREAGELRPRWAASRWLGKALSQLGHLDEAEAILLGLLPAHPVVHGDLAWVYERRGDNERALEAVEAHLRHFPDDEFHAAQRLKLKGVALSAEELDAEVDDLEDLGEEVPPEIVPTYVRRLLETGRGADARRFVEARRDELPPATLLSVAWAAHKLSAFDLALGLFITCVPDQLGNPKFVAAAARAARACNRTDELAARYRECAASDPRGFGLAKRLEKGGAGAASSSEPSA